MAANNPEYRVPLKLLVDEKKNKVIAAEANRDFVDILFSFLTFPIGTVIRLTNGSTVSTCMNNLYRSVENLNDKHLCSEHCKSILLDPRNPCIEDCFKLKVNIDDSVTNKYFKCSSKDCSSKSWLLNVKCSCGGRTTKEIFSDILNPTTDFSGVFLSGGIEFIVSDDLRVLPSSSSLIQLLSDLGYSHMDQIKEMSVEVGKEEILRLLTCSLTSKSPLTDVFLNKQATVKTIMPEPRKLPVSLNELRKNGNSGTLSLKLILSKSRNKILYAEAKDSFVDFLFSFLTFPIGSVIYALKEVYGIGCVGNLYKSVEDLESEWFLCSRDRLLIPRVAPKHECREQLLPIYAEKQVRSLIIDPRDMSGVTRAFGRFTKAPSLFIVLDNLEVRPLCSTSSFGLLKELNVPLYDIEERVVSFGAAEAWYLLQAALNESSSALTLAFSSFWNQQKQEMDKTATS